MVSRQTVGPKWRLPAGSLLFNSQQSTSDGRACWRERKTRAKVHATTLELAYALQRVKPRLTGREQPRLPFVQKTARPRPTLRSLVVELRRMSARIT